jgi:methionyl-tRNA formyltransferase
MTEVLDGGPIYDSIEIKLDGNINDIFMRISECIERMIIKICKQNPTPISQSGEVYSFNRLSYSDNKILDSFQLRQIYDRIRMVDGGGYKRSFIDFGQYRIEFSNATYNGDNLFAIATFYLKS